MKKVRAKVQRVWDLSPKTVKVLVYVAVAGGLKAVADALNADMFAFLPLEYRVPAFNLAVVLLIELAKKFQESRSK